MEKHQLESLRELLPRGWQPELKKRTGKSDTHISEVLNGKTEGLDVLEAALELAQENQKRKKDLQAKAKRVLKQK
jgi:hypothetical protein